MSNATRLFNRHHFSHHGAKAAQRKLTVVRQMPVGRKPVFSAVLHHRREHQAVGQSHATQGHGAKQ